MLICKSKMILWIFIPIVAIQAADDFDDFFTFSDEEQNIGPNLGRILADDKYINPDQVKSYIIFGYYDNHGQTFETARLSCLHKGGKLAEPMNSRENQQIFSKLGDGKRHYWIGLTDVNNEGQ